MSSLAMTNLLRLYGIQYTGLRRQAMLDKKPTLLGQRQGLHLYEHPTRGDEAGILADDGETLVQTDMYDLSDFEEDML